MAFLSGEEFFNNYLLGKILPNNEFILENKSKIVRSWDILLSHIENNLKVNINPFSFTCLPTLPTAIATASSAGFPNGKVLSNTGNVYAQTFINTVILSLSGYFSSEDIERIRNNITKTHNSLFSHIVSNAVVTISDIKTSGTIATSNGPVSFSGTSTTPATGSLS